MHIEAINAATRDIPPEQLLMHLCWGNYEGPHNHDVPLAEIIGIVLRARPPAIPFEAANPRHEHECRRFEDIKLPEDKVLLPGVSTRPPTTSSTPSWWPSGSSTSRERSAGSG